MNKLLICNCRYLVSQPGSPEGHEIIARARQWCDKFSLDYQRMKWANQPMFRRIHPEFQHPKERSL